MGLGKMQGDRKETERELHLQNTISRRYFCHSLQKTTLAQRVANNHVLHGIEDDLHVLRIGGARHVCVDLLVRVGVLVELLLRREQIKDTAIHNTIYTSTRQRGEQR
jgi:hypothetical protein